VALWFKYRPFASIRIMEIEPASPFSPIPPHRTRAVVFSLVTASAICLLLLVARAYLAQEIGWTGFFGNLILAWIPMLFSWQLCWQLDRPKRRRWLIGALFVGWLLFFPNAAYIVTDMVHLKSRDPIPRWFDYILITAYAWTGLVLGYVSLTLLHYRVRAALGRAAGWGFVALMLGLGSFGIYLGRFLRWNSWDVFARPWKPINDLAKFLEFPTLRQVVGFCGTFFLLSVLVYLVLHAIAHLHAPAASQLQDDSNAPR
jgi:uncharacterized membrane protein